MLNFQTEYFLKNNFRRLGLNISRFSSAGQIAGFLKLCYPKTTEIPLIRLGEKNDGGYLLPDDMEGISACFSPGVAESSGFENDMAKRGITSFLADYSVEGPAIHSPLFHFDKKFIGTTDDEKFIRLESWVKSKNVGAGDLILQMDIEGAEYDVIMDTPEEILRKFRIILIEFHGLQFLSEPFALKWIQAAFKKLLNDFEIVHIHPNNYSPVATIRGFDIPPMLEISFLRKDRIISSTYTKSLPHDLDRCCSVSRQDYALPSCWLYKPTKADSSNIPNPSEKMD